MSETAQKNNAGRPRIYPDTAKHTFIQVRDPGRKLTKSVLTATKKHKKEMDSRHRTVTGFVRLCCNNTELIIKALAEADKLRD